MFDMDQFNVPKKVNRHVFKAVSVLQTSRSGFVSAELINQHVKRQLRRSKNMPNLDGIIHQSLANLTNLGVLACTGSSDYAIRHTIKCSTDEYSLVSIPMSKVDTSAAASRKRSPCSNPVRVISADSAGNVRLSKRVPRNRKGSVKTVKRGPASRTKRVRAPSLRQKRSSQRRPSIMCIACRSALMDLVKICQMINQCSSMDAHVTPRTSGTHMVAENEADLHRESAIPMAMEIEPDVVPQDSPMYAPSYDNSQGYHANHSA
ncbi:uncharacterized protein vrs [Drosophila montana]|uniref:uncharacterized protein vrs n=1 Tax=Drosophila montana TaxID=40370 RepID=UPI00313AD8C3